MDDVKNHYVSICAVHKDENKYIKEWIDYHVLLGFDHFYIYDNLSQIPLKNTINDLGSQYKDLVTVILHRDEYPSTYSSKQTYAYGLCLEQYGGENQWIAFIDIDEFIVIHRKNNIKKFLREYVNFGGIVLNWQVFGSSGMKKKAVNILEYFIHKMPESDPMNQHIKTIVNTEYTVGPGMDPHTFIYKKPYYSVNENKKKTTGPIADVNIDIAQINHYFLRSRQEFIEKMERGRGDIDVKRSMDEFDAVDKLCTIEDDNMSYRLNKMSKDKFFIHSIYFNPVSKKTAESSGFIPCDNIDKLTPFYENEIIIKTWMDKKYNTNSYVGFLSWRFYDKTKISDSLLKSTIMKNEQYDAFIASPPAFKNNKYPYDYEKSFEPVHQLATIIDTSYEGLLPCKLKDNSWVTCWCNYWIVTPEIFNLYVTNFLYPIYKFFNTTKDKQVRQLLDTPNIHYIGNIIKPHPMFCEGLFGKFISHYKIPYKEVRNETHYKRVVSLLES